MADVTISSLPLDTPQGNSVLPYSNSITTKSSPVSAIFQNTTAGIGIGTSNPNGTLAVVRNGGNGIILQTSASSPNTSIILSANYNNTGRVALAASSEITTRPGLSIITNDAERILISKDGYITKPFQAGFKATVTNQSQSTGQTILWDTVEYANPAGSFNTSTGEWTVPQSGRYLIIVNLISARNTTAGDWYIDVYVNNGLPNGSRLYTSKAGNGNVHAQLNASTILNLNTGDKIKTVLTSGVGSVAPSAIHNQFSAELLG